MSAIEFAARAAEFPNDNPLLHEGARWVCRDTRGPARAMMRALAGDPCRVAELPPAEVLAQPASDAIPESPVVPRSPARVYEGPLELDLDRIVIAHRVENIPPPPDFVLRPFVPSPPRAPAERELVNDVAIEPRSCEVVDGGEARRRVRRGPRVDIAPCLSVDAPAVSAAEVPPRARRRGPTQARVLVACPLPEMTELERAILELEAAFAKPALHSKAHEGARVIPCPAGGA